MMTTLTTAPGIAPLVFHNPGELDPRLIGLMGANVKPQAGSIGQFGTGMKYAIAGVLRLGGAITIWSGLREFRFAASQETIRGKEFQVVTMHGPGGTERLGFTLDLGRHWAPWMVYRELWANAHDEGGGVQVAHAVPSPGTTLVVIAGGVLNEAHSTRSAWLIEPGSRPLAVAPGLEVYETAVGGERGGFYQGIKVTELSVPAAFRYNLTNHVALTEDRTLDQWRFQVELVRRVFGGLKDPEILTEFVLPSQGGLEASLEWSYASGDPTPELLALTAELRKRHPGTMSQGIWKALRDRLPREAVPDVPLRPLEHRALQKAVAFLAKHGHHIEAPIRVKASLGSQWIAGMVGRPGKELPSDAPTEIWLAHSAFGKGVKFLASTLLEEHLHATEGLPDESRAMQDWLFDRLIGLMEEIDGEPL